MLKSCARRGRVTIQERDAEMEDSEEVIKKREKELVERKKQSHDLVADTIRRELAESESSALIFQCWPDAYHVRGDGGERT